MAEAMEVVEAMRVDGMAAEAMKVIIMEAMVVATATQAITLRLTMTTAIENMHLIQATVRR